MSKSSRHGCHADAGCQSIGLARGWRCALHPLLKMSGAIFDVIKREEYFIQTSPCAKPCHVDSQEASAIDVVEAQNVKA